VAICRPVITAAQKWPVTIPAANRHWPKCQTLAKERWLEARCAELLPVPHFHLVFTLPHEINPLAQGNPKGLVF